MDRMQVIERFSRIEHSVHALCDGAAVAPAEVRSCLDELDRRSGEVRRLVEDRPEAVAEDDDAATITPSGGREHPSVHHATDDLARLYECVDTLKSLGDRAAQAADAADGIDTALRERIHEVQDQIAHFRRQLQ